MKKQKKQSKLLKEYSKKITLDAFDYDVYVILTTDVRKSLKKRNVEDIENTGAYHVQIKNKPISYIILPFPETNVGYVVHELWHCIWAIHDYIGAKFENEIVAYLLSYLTRETVKFITRKNKFLCL